MVLQIPASLISNWDQICGNLTAKPPDAGGGACTSAMPCRALHVSCVIRRRNGVCSIDLPIPFAGP